MFRFRISTCALLLALSIACEAQQATPGKQKNSHKEMDEDPPEVKPLLLRGPYLQNATPTSMMIRWRTDALSRSKVWFGSEKDSLISSVEDSSLVTEHKITIRGLIPLSKYFYKIGAIKEVLQGDTANYFFTLPKPGSTGTLRIAAFGDCGNNSVNQRNVRDQLLKYLGGQPLNAWILLGDNTYPNGTDAEFQSNFFNIYKDNLLKSVPLFPSPGNHDYHDVEFSAAFAQHSHQVAYFENFSTPINGESGGEPSHEAAYYSFDIGNIHFLSLDSYGKEQGMRLYDTLGPQVEWIKKDLEKAQGAAWIIAYWHHPPFTMGSHNGDKEEELVKIKENFIPILERNGVDIVLCGHSHDYERSRLMRGYYGNEASFDSTKFLLSNSSGRADGSTNSQPYTKAKKHGKGTVYVVSGSAGKLGGIQSDYPHNAMYYSDAEHGGSSLIVVNGDRLDFKWICADGKIRDQFSIVKK